MTAGLLTALAFPAPAGAQAAAIGPAPTVGIAAEAPEISIEAMPSRGPAPVMVSFNPTVNGYHPWGKWKWTFGDGDASNFPPNQTTKPNAEHLYKQPCHCKATLAYTDTDGKFGPKDTTYKASIVLNYYKGRTVGLTAERVSGQPLDVRYTVTFQDTSGLSEWQYYLTIFDAKGDVVKEFSTLSLTTKKSVTWTYRFDEHGVYRALAEVTPGGNSILGPPAYGADTIENSW